MFQFTHPGKGATSIPAFTFKMLFVSIHAPWEGCDQKYQSVTTNHRGFNSRTLGRVRPSLGKISKLCLTVSIHAPWEGCDKHHVLGALVNHHVSIHAPWEGCDVSLPTERIAFPRFNSRTLGRVRHLDDFGVVVGVGFQFTHPGKGATAGWR